MQDKFWVGIALLFVVLAGVFFTYQLLPRQIPPSNSMVSIDPIPMRVVIVEDLPENEPEFKRQYTVHLPEDRTVSVIFASPRYATAPRREVYGYGVITSVQGRILFNIDKIATDILNPSLRAPIQSIVDQMKEMDDEYWKETPKSFVDRNGVVWERRETK